MNIHDPVTPTTVLADPSGSTTLTPLSSALSLSQATGMSSGADRNGKSTKPIVHQTTGITRLSLEE